MTCEKFPNRRSREIPEVKVETFVKVYLETLDATHAAREAGYGGNNLSQTGYWLMRHPKVKPRIEAALQQRLAELKLNGDRVLRDLWDILMADANELIEHRRACCRYCYGAGFKYQRTAGEMATDRKAYERDLKAAQRMNTDLVEGLGEFDEQGGIGFDPRLDPNPDCPECFGEGLTSVFVKDTRNLSPGARALYAGVKLTKDGLEVKMHSKEKAIELLGRHLALFNDKLDVNVKGDLATRILQARKRGKNEGEDLV